MPRLSSSEYAALIDRRNAKQRRIPDDGSERSLQDRIVQYCNGVGWICHRNRMDKPTTAILGWPDLTVLASMHRTFLIECKTRTGNLSNEQRGLHMLAARIGHTVHVVRSFEEFTKLIEERPHHD